MSLLPQACRLFPLILFLEYTRTLNLHVKKSQREGRGGGLVLGSSPFPSLVGLQVWIRADGRSRHTAQLIMRYNISQDYTRCFVFPGLTKTPESFPSMRCWVRETVIHSGGMTETDLLWNSSSHDSMKISRSSLWFLQLCGLLLSVVDDSSCWTPNDELPLFCLWNNIWEQQLESLPRTRLF